MSSLSLPRTGATGHRTMAAIEARRVAQHPVFVTGTVVAFAVLTLMFAISGDDPHFLDVLATPVIPAFFIGLSSLVVTARLTRSTEATAEAIGTAPNTEARRTTALALACLVPFAAGVAWVATLLVMVAARPVAPQEWWLGTLPDWEVWTILLALGPVACLGGGLLGVLTGRWLRFPGAPAVVVVGVVVIDMVGQLGYAFTDRSELRLWVPWAMFHSGTMPDGTQEIVAGNPAAYLGYLLCLCAAAALVAIWHDPNARTRRLRAAIAGVVVVGLGCLALAITTGSSDNRVSDPIPYKVTE